MRFLVVAAVVALAGCNSVPPEKLAAIDDAQCQSYGVAPGSNAYVACRMQLADQHHQDRIERKRQIASAFDDLSHTPLVVSQPQRPTQTRTSCTTQRALGIGNPLETSCTSQSY
jgi:hypothetical protein